MEHTTYTGLSRQTGLLTEMQVVANNIANLSTTGFRREGVVFSEFVVAGDEPLTSVSMARAGGRFHDLGQGGLQRTGGTFDLAIEGEGFFLIEGAGGNMLSRAGAFTPNEAGELVNADGARLLDLGGAPIFVPASAVKVAIAPDGTISADGTALGQIGLFGPAEGATLSSVGGTGFLSDSEFQQVEGGRIFQGYLESSNVNPVSEITRMIEVQRAYELGQSLLDQEHERVRGVIQTLMK